jgi:hypothetical protein
MELSTFLMYWIVAGTLLYFCITTLIGALIGTHKGRSTLGWAGIGLLCGMHPVVGLIALVFLAFLVPSKP